MNERGHLRIYLGSAPGVGKTFAMLGEGHRRAERGTDVVVAVVEDHGRSKTAEMVKDLEVLPRKRVAYRGAEFYEMDVEAVLVRHPEQVLVDEYAHTNVPGCANEKRWQDVEQILDAGIDVITTLNIQHLESVNDVVQSITGILQRETIPDEVVRRAGQIELVDMTPEALRRRMAHGNIYSPEKIDAALSNYFREGNLSALRELALLWLADRVDEGLMRYRADHDIDSTWEARERVVVGLTGGSEGETLIRRATRIAARGGADLLAVHVVQSDGLTGSNPATLSSQRSLVEALGGSYHQVVGDDVAAALLAFARAENATQLVLGATRRGRARQRLMGPGLEARVIRESGPIDVHVVTHEEIGRRPEVLRLRGALSRQRQLIAVALALVALTLVTFGLAGWRDQLNLPSDLLIYLLVIVGVAMLGGIWPGLLAALAGSLLVNYYFTPPIHKFTIGEMNNAIAIIVFVAVAVMVSVIVDVSSRRNVLAARASAEATSLASLSGSVLRGRSSIADLLTHLREMFEFAAVGLQESDDYGRWSLVMTKPDQVSPSSIWDQELSIDDTHRLVMFGPTPAATQQRVLEALAMQVRVALTQQHLIERSAESSHLAEADRTRSALLAAVSHDLRTPLASLNAALSSLASSDVDWSAVDRAELLDSSRRSLARLNRLVENLLDMSRLQAGALAVHMQPVALEDAVAAALDEAAPASFAVRVELPDDLSTVAADQPLLERVLANLLANALRFSPKDQPPLLTASQFGDRIEVRLIDHGPGISARDIEKVFLPFQRLGDNDNTTGVGLGLALARGLTEAMSGALVPEETPGGGLTMVVQLRATTSSTSTLPSLEE
jgi:two-component system sensor histidine kinase KdpD